jgi:mannose/fructose/N-acetylgalactosamine-specific phosphotransferase system component IIC
LDACAGAQLGGAFAVTQADDKLSEGWKIALYAAALIPYGSWFVVLGSSILYYAWRKETPNKAAQINKHGWLAWLLGMVLWGAIWFLISKG